MGGGSRNMKLVASKKSSIGNRFFDPLLPLLLLLLLLSFLLPFVMLVVVLVLVDVFVSHRFLFFAHGSCFFSSFFLRFISRFFVSVRQKAPRGKKKGQKTSQPQALADAPREGPVPDGWRTPEIKKLQVYFTFPTRLLGQILLITLRIYGTSECDTWKYLVIFSILYLFHVANKK